MAGTVPIPRLNGSGTVAGHARVQSPHAVQAAVTCSALRRTITRQPAPSRRAAVTWDRVRTRTSGFFESRRVLISMPHDGGQSLGKYW